MLSANQAALSLPLFNSTAGENKIEKLMHQNKHREHHRKNRLDLGKINFNLLPIKKMIRMVRKKNKSTFPAPHRSSQNQVLFFIPKSCSIFYLLLPSTFYFLDVPSQTAQDVWRMWGSYQFISSRPSSLHFFLAPVPSQTAPA